MTALIEFDGPVILPEPLDLTEPLHVSVSQQRLDNSIQRQLARPAARSCTCGLHAGMSRAQLRALGSGCTGARHGWTGYVCPVLDRVRRETGA